jgi:uncharacterized protein YjbJ (UPF0337 family)
MVNEQTLQGNWNEIKGKLRTKWGQLTNDDLQQAHGNVDQLIGLIQRKTGEARNSVEKFLEDATAGGSSGLNQAAETAREYGHQAMEAVQQRSQQAAESFKRSYGQAAESLQHGYEEAESMIREKPAESAAVCFGIGMVVGVILGLALRGR